MFEIHKSNANVCFTMYILSTHPLMYLYNIHALESHRERQKSVIPRSKKSIGPNSYEGFALHFSMNSYLTPRSLCLNNNSRTDSIFKVKPCLLRLVHGNHPAVTGVWTLDRQSLYLENTSIPLYPVKLSPV